MRGVSPNTKKTQTYKNAECDGKKKFPFQIKSNVSHFAELFENNFFQLLSENYTLLIVFQMFCWLRFACAQQTISTKHAGTNQMHQGDNYQDFLKWASCF